jgi:hypothetical protein
MATVQKPMKKAAPVKKAGPYSDERTKALDAASVYGKGKMKAPGAKYGKTVKKAKDGKSFPDLNKDGKITKADILKGRGVIAKKGAKVTKSSGMKKCKYGCK